MQTFSDVEINSPGAPEWERLQGQVVDSAYEVWEFLRADSDRAFFRATPLRRTRGTGEETVSEYFLMLEHAEDPGADVRLKRYLEASFLRDVNLLRVYHAGRAHVAGRDYVYVVSERADFTLSDFEENRETLTQGMPELIQNLVDGLSQLHSEGLVYCALRAESVWRVGEQWKLADYSQLRVSGQHEEDAALFNEPESPYRPPEAALGEVSPAWDVWTLGVLIKSLAQSAGTGVVKTMAANGNGQSYAQPAALPHPFTEIVDGALLSSPGERLSLGEISFKLNSVERQPVEQSLSAPVSEESMVETQLREPNQPEPKSPESKPQAGYSLVNPNASGTGVVGYSLVSREELEARRSSNQSAEEPPPRANLLKAFLIAFTIAAVPAAGYFTWTTWGSEIRTMLHQRGLYGTHAPATSDAAPAIAAPTDAPARVETTSPPDPIIASGSTTAFAVLNLLDRWKQAGGAHNLDRVMACYAPRVAVYFNRRDLTDENLRFTKGVEFKSATKPFEITHIHFVTVTPDRVVVTFDKTIPDARQRRRPSVIHEQVTLSKIDDAWKISSEGLARAAESRR